MANPTNTASPNEIDLISAVARGDEKAVELFYRTHCDAVLRFVFRRASGSFEDAQEIAQDTFLSALRLSATYRGESSAYVWLCGIARLRIVDFVRRQGREKRVPPANTLRLDETLAEMLTDGNSVDDRAHEAVDRLMEVLSEDEREAMMMRYVEELSVREIATLLGRSEKGIENLLLRAKEKQRKSVVAAQLALRRPEAKP